MVTEPGAAVQPEPFYNHFPAFFKYPLNSASVLVLGGLAVALVFSSFAGLLGLFVQFICIAFFFTYASEQMRHASQGNTEPPQVSTNMVGNPVGKQITGLMLLAWIFIFVVAVRYGSGMFWLAALGVQIVMPAVIMSVVATQSIAASLNPGTWLGVMQRLGGNYFVVVLVGGLLSGFGFLPGNGGLPSLQGEATGWLAQVLLVFFEPDSMAAVLTRMLVVGVLGTYLMLYFLTVEFVLMGYVMFQHHEELGIDIDPIAVQPRPSGGDNGEEPIVAQARGFAQDGRPEEAMSLLEGELRARGGSFAVHDYYRKLLKAANNREKLLEHGRELITVALNFDDYKRALLTADECVGLDPKFEPAEPGQVKLLVEKAMELGRSDLVVKLAQGFAKRHPGHPDIPANYLAAARVMVDKLGKDEQAKNLLQGLLKKYPDHKLAPQMRECLELAEQLSAG